jgi:catechol 2,3-dioxygenase-like lactoylglutathione lyase family enzyme
MASDSFRPLQREAINPMTINATLQRLVLSSPNPEKMGEFYGRAFDYAVSGTANESHCEGPNRSLWFRQGEANRLLESHFVFPDTAALDLYVAQLQARGVSGQEKTSAGARYFAVRDPDGREVWFGVAAGTRKASEASSRPARLQHYAVHNPSPQTMVDFYVGKLDFTVADRVLNDSGKLTAVFLRTDREHHTLAVFGVPGTRFDHCSCETRDWLAVRDWADHIAKQKVKIVWGVGRHGPGHNAFFMVRDPDGNLVEISAELEAYGDDHPAGQWLHHADTLDLWGTALMRA